MGERLLSREDVLGGLAARRAPMVVQAIRSRTAARVARSRRALGGYPADAGAASREQDFLAALAAGRDLPRKPTVRDLERYAEAWEPLVPADPKLRLAVARLLAADEPLPRDRVPRLRAALGLDELDAESVYAERLSLLDRLRWRRARLAERLERLPPFWTAFALTVTECVGAGILALPVAMAGIGPIGAVLLLVVFGAVNVVTVAAVVEAIARTGSMRYGTAYFDRLVADHLGPLGARMLGLALFVLNAAMLPVTLLGFGTILESATGLAAWVWAAVLFAVNLELLRRERLDATIASALVIGAVNIALILALVAVAFLHLQSVNFEQVNVPLLDGRPVDTGVLALIFGVVLLAFFGHTSAANAAKVVLERDPSGRALLTGNVAALGAATILYSLTALAFTGALDRVALEGSDGTVLEPLAARAGPAVHVLGSAFAVLAVGMGSVYACLRLYNQVSELRPQADRRRRFALGAAAPLVLFGLLLWLMASGRESFTAPLGYAGALTAPVVGGLFPMLLAVAAGMVAVAIVAWAQGGFRARAVVELRREPERDLGLVAVTVAGETAQARVELDGRPAETGAFEGFSAVRQVTVRMPAGAPADTAVWAHRVTPEGDSIPLAADVEVADGVVAIGLRPAR